MAGEEIKPDLGPRIDPLAAAALSRRIRREVRGAGYVLVVTEDPSAAVAARWDRALSTLEQVKPRGG